VVALVIAPSIALSSDAVTAYVQEEVKKEVSVDVTFAQGEGEIASAVITTTTTKDGIETTEEETLTGTLEEIRAEVDKRAADVDAEAGRVVRKVEIKEKG
jgi:K(+)-stimulated pyrophosphate-energized sodium pump